MRIVTHPGAALAGWMVALALAVSPTNLQASAFTETSTYLAFVNSNYTYAYNGPFGPISTGTGTGSSGGCYPQLPAGSTCTISPQGTLSALATLNSSFDALTMTGSVPTDSLGRPGVSGSATATAFSDGPSASIGVYATGTHASPNGTEVGGSGSAAAGFSDVLHFRVAGASASTVTLIPVSYTVTGFLSSGPFGSSSIDATFDLGGANFSESIFEAANTGFLPRVSNNQSGGWSSQTLTFTGPAAFTFRGLYAITGSTADAAVYEYLSAQGGGSGVSDYSRTGIVSFNLPSNVSFTSDSGVFLTQAAGVSTTPEPAALLLSLGGLVLIGAGRLRAKRRSLV